MRLFFLITIIFFSGNLFSQENAGSIHGNFQTDFQLLTEDSVTGASYGDDAEKFRYIAFGNLIFSKGDFETGVRFESYESPILGYPDGYAGHTGVPYRYASYEISGLNITLGNYYDQFGSGLVFRSYEERNLGYDNAMDGVRLIYKPSNAITLKGIIGKQRTYFNKGEGIVRGLDGEISLNELFNCLSECKTQFILGASFVSKYQKDNDPIYKLPKNVGTWGGRININKGRFSLYTEYAYKINDPSALNNYIYKPGNAIIVNTTYAKKGLGVLLSLKRIDNMNFRSEANAKENNLLINYLPAYNKQHTYALPALYPYATQANGEIGLQADIIYKFKKGSWLGGKYGTSVALNFSNSYAIDKTPIHDTIVIGDNDNGTLGYESDFFTLGNEQYFQDFNIEISKKFSKKFSLITSYINLKYNKAIIEGYAEYDFINANIFVIDALYKVRPMHSIRIEYQHMLTKQDINNVPGFHTDGDWAMGLIEYTFAPHWFLALQNQFNYGGIRIEDDEIKGDFIEIEEAKIHYPTLSIGYTKGGNKFIVNYGRQRAGIFCVGGVCREVPASTGLSISVTSTF